MSRRIKCIISECIFADYPEELLNHIIEEHRLKPASDVLNLWELKNFVYASPTEMRNRMKARECRPSSNHHFNQKCYQDQRTGYRERTRCSPIKYPEQCNGQKEHNVYEKGVVYTRRNYISEFERKPDTKRGPSDENFAIGRQNCEWMENAIEYDERTSNEDVGPYANKRREHYTDINERSHQHKQDLLSRCKETVDQILRKPQFFYPNGPRQYKERFVPQTRLHSDPRKHHHSDPRRGYKWSPPLIDRGNRGQRKRKASYQTPAEKYFDGEDNYYRESSKRPRESMNWEYTNKYTSGDVPDVNSSASVSNKPSTGSHANDIVLSKSVSVYNKPSTGSNDIIPTISVSPSKEPTGSHDNDFINIKPTAVTMENNNTIHNSVERLSIEKQSTAMYTEVSKKRRKSEFSTCIKPHVSPTSRCSDPNNNRQKELADKKTGGTDMIVRRLMKLARATYSNDTVEGQVHASDIPHGILSDMIHPALSTNSNRYELSQHIPSTPVTDVVLVQGQSNNQTMESFDVCPKLSSIKPEIPFRSTGTDSKDVCYWQSLASDSIHPVSMHPALSIACKKEEQLRIALPSVIQDSVQDIVLGTDINFDDLRSVTDLIQSTVVETEEHGQTLLTNIVHDIKQEPNENDWIDNMHAVKDDYIIRIEPVMNIKVEDDQSFQSSVVPITNPDEIKRVSSNSSEMPSSIQYPSETSESKISGQVGFPNYVSKTKYDTAMATEVSHEQDCMPLMIQSEIMSTSVLFHTIENVVQDTVYYTQEVDCATSSPNLASRTLERETLNEINGTPSDELSSTLKYNPAKFMGDYPKLVNFNSHMSHTMEDGRGMNVYIPSYKDIKTTFIQSEIVSNSHLSPTKPIESPVSPTKSIEGIVPASLKPNRVEVQGSKTMVGGRDRRVSRVYVLTDHGIKSLSIQSRVVSRSVVSSVILATRVHESLNIEGFQEMLDLLMNFPLPWKESQLFSKLFKCMPHLKKKLTPFSNTLQVICKTSAFVMDIKKNILPSKQMRSATPQTVVAQPLTVELNKSTLELLNSNGLGVMFDILKVIPFHWCEHTLYPVMKRALPSYSDMSVYCSLHMVCTTSRVVIDMP